MSAPKSLPWHASLSMADLYNKFRRSRDCFLTWSVRRYVCMCVCLYVSASLHLGSFWQLLRCADKRIDNIMKMYIEWNKVQVELIRFRKNLNFIHVHFCESINTIQYRSPNATLDSCGQTMSIVTSRWPNLSHIVHNSIEWCGGGFFLLTYINYWTACPLGRWNAANDSDVLGLPVYPALLKMSTTNIK